MSTRSARGSTASRTGWSAPGVDVLAMQETKCSDDQFPAMPFLAAGYEVVHCGFNQWNGVAIASRVGFDDVQIGFEGQPVWSDKPDVEAAAEARALGATCNGVRVWSLYIPNGRFVGSPHYYYQVGMACRAS
jgi:exodeoxyribonuclease III